MIEQFCECQTKCKEDTEDTWTCCAHMQEGRVFQCPFSTADLKMIGGRLIMSHKGEGLGQCQDWELPRKEEATKL